MAENLNLKTIETVDTRPFRKLVMTIGELPTSFIESMTYYELLAWFVNYLETVIIPTVNNNAEAVEELQGKFTELNTAFNTLKSWVEDYFDNLDVQEEINNKLDDMADQGILQEIITTYIQSNVAWTFDTVADMKLSTNLVNGSFARTLGFHTLNDGGGALYKITDTGTANEMDVIAIGNLFGNLVLQETMNVRQFGAKGDSTNDDTANIQRAIDKCRNVTVPTGTYMIDAGTSVNMVSNTKLTLDNDATLKAIPNSLTNYDIIKISNVSNVEISGGTIEGERESHIGTSGEWGVCISVTDNSSNIYIHDMTLKKSWGDGLYINTATNIRTSNLIIDNTRRNGISIISVENYKSLNDTIMNVAGTAPQMGVDIEPNYSIDKLIDIVFENLHTENNANSALGIMLSNTPEDNVSIKILNHFDNGSNDGFNVIKTSTSKGLITNHNAYYINNKMRGVAMGRCYDSDLKVIISKPYILNNNTSGESGVNYSSPISSYIEPSHGEGTIGNIEIIEPYIETSNTITNSITFNNQTNVTPKINNVKIIDPVNIKTGTYISISYPGSNIFYSDKYNITTYSITANTNVVASRLHGLYTLKNTVTANKVITLVEGYEIGRKLKFRNDSLNSGASFSIQFPASNFIRQLSASGGAKLTLNNFGDSIEIQKMTDTEWAIVSSNCTPTVA